MLCFCGQFSHADPNHDHVNYQLLRGDVNSDGTGGDYYFSSHRIFQKFGGISFFVDGPPTFALYLDPVTQQFSDPVPLSLSDTQIASLGLADATPTSEFENLVDVDGNGRPDLFVPGDSDPMNSLVLLDFYNQIPTVVRFPTDGVLELAAATLTLFDFNNDSYVDLYVARNGNYGNQYFVSYGTPSGTFSGLTSISNPLLPDEGLGDPIFPMDEGSVVAATRGTPNVNRLGAAQYNIGLVTPPAINNLKPNLSLSYNSQRGAGELGVGWSVSGTSTIHRCEPSFATEGYRGAVPQSQSERLCLDGEKLIAIDQSVPATDSEYWSTGTEYRTERESFLKIVSYGSYGDGPDYFKAWTRSGQVLEFGNSTDSQLVVPTHNNIDSWGLNQVTDPYGNSYEVTYGGDRTIGEYFLSRIDYSPGTAVRFEYVDRATGESTSRPDQPRGFNAGGTISTTKLLDKVTTYINVTAPSDPQNGTPVREYQLAYERGENTDRFRLANLTECGYDEVGVQTSCARPTEFDWAPGEQGFDTPTNLNVSGLDADANPIVVDLDNNGVDDFIWVKNGTWHVLKGTASGYSLLDSGLSEGTDLFGGAQPIRIDHRYGLLVGEQNLINGSLITVYYTKWSLILFDLDNIANTQVSTVFDTGVGEYFFDYANVDIEATASVMVGDVNGDGLDDFYVSHTSSLGTHSVFHRIDATWSETESNFTSQDINVAQPNPEGGYRGLLAGSRTDFDQDGYHDVFIRDKDTSQPTDNTRKWIRSTGSSMEAASGWILPRGDGLDVERPYRYVFRASKKSGGFFNRSHVKMKITIAGAEIYQNTRNGFFTDLNADGLEDYVVRLTDAGATNGTWRFYLNQGGSFGSEIDTGVSTGSYVNQFAFLMDYDRDGTMDFVAQRPDGTAWRVLLVTQVETYTGSGIYQPNLEIVEQDPFQGELDHLLNFDIINDPVPITTDVNNDDILDVIYVDNGVWKVLTGKPQQPDLLERVTDGLGLMVEFDYSPLSGTHVNGDPIYTHENSGNVFPHIDETAGTTVVKTLRLSNSVGTGTNAFNDQYYQYKGAKIDLQRRGFSGFSEIQVTDQRTGIETKTTYHQSFPYTGLKSSVTVTRDQGTGSVLEQTDYVYDVKSLNNNQTVYPYLDTLSSRRYHWDYVAGELHSWSFVDNTFDDWGNLTAKTSQGGRDTNGVSAPVTEFTTTQVISVVNDTTQWLLGFVDQHTTTHQGFGGAANKTVVHSYTQHPSTLDVASSTQFVGTDIWLTTTFQRDGTGKITNGTATGGDIDSTTAPLRTLSTLSNFQVSLYPLELRNADNRLTTVTYDTRFGAIDSVTDPNNILEHQDYNAFGQLTDAYHADGSQTRTIYNYCDELLGTCPTSAVYRVVVEQFNNTVVGKQGAPRQYQYFDNLDRLVRTEMMDFQGTTNNLIRVDREYDLHGLLSKETLPHTAGETSLATCEIDNQCTVFEYDVSGRLTRTVRPDGGETEHTYSAHTDYPNHVESKETVIEPDTTISYQTEHRYLNSLGQLTSLTDANATPIAYLYNAQGLLSSVTVNDDSDTTITSTFDVAGNQRTLVDPDAGELHYHYSGLGQLRREIQAPNTPDEKTTLISYDLLGRQVSQVNSGGTSTWQYDTQKIGLLDSVSGTDYSETYAYDSLSRLQSVNTSLTGSSTRNYSFSFGYDDFSRIESTTYPSGLSVRNLYQTAGFLGSIINDTTEASYWKINQTNSRGQVTEEQLGNGLVTKTSYNALNGLLSTLATGTSTANNIQSLSYTFDSLGNLRSRESKRETSLGVIEETLNESFNYDSLNRLTDATTTGLSSGTRVVSYTYDDLGNLKTRTGVGTYEYEQINGAGVHGVTSADGKTFHYDARGNMTQNGNRNLTYSSLNKPLSISNGTSTTTFKYGPNHARFYQNTDGKETYYVAGGLYEEIIESGVTTQRSYVGGVLVHEKTGAAEQVRYLHRDHLGSVEAITDELGDRVERLAFAPFGDRRMADWSDGSAVSMTMTRGFTGHEHVDTFNLIHMNGRVFDPSIGRFLSADPIVQAPANTQSYNRYSYVFNNPLSFTDPSGYGACIGWGEPTVWYCSGGSNGNSDGNSGSSGGSPGSGSSGDNDSTGEIGAGSGFDGAGDWYSSGGTGSGRTGGQIVSEFRAMFAIVDRFAIPIKKMHGAIASNAVAMSSRVNDNVSRYLANSRAAFMSSMNTDELKRQGWNALGGLPGGQTAAGTIKLGTLLLVARATKAAPHSIVNALKSFKSSNFQFGSQTFKLEKSGLKHILERHHLSFWNGTSKAKQSFFSANMSIESVQSAISSVLKQNRATLSQKGTRGMYQVEGSYNGVNYILGVNRGRVGQFYPK
jgi:RHS repeat-associated protein